MKQQGKPPNRNALVVLGSIAGVLVLVICAGVIGGITMSGSDGQEGRPAAQPSGTVGTGADIPPEPDAKNWSAYIAALTAIDPDIVHGKEEKAVDRGRDQCGSVRRSPNDQAKLVDLTTRRFISPDHPEGFGQAKSARILAAVRKYICPTY